MDILNEVIAAVSTPRGTGGVAVIRISGDGCFEVAEKCIELKCKRSFSELIYGKMYMCSVLDEAGKVVDRCMCAAFKAPHSYTGEDTVEIYCHGGALSTSTVLESVFSSGARQAIAGEFTKRAYINGKMSLSAAEAVGELIHAKTKAAITLSNSNINGTFDNKVNDICEKIKTLLASVYVYIDYPDEELYDVSADEMRMELENIKSDIDKLSSSYRSGMAVNEGVKTVIVGTPNTGKSTMLNMLCGKKRAIVTDIAGTTRDIVTEDVVLGDVLLRLSDTAGVRDTDDTVEKIGVGLSLSALSDSELVIAMFDGSRELSEDDETLIEKIKESGKTVIAVVNKSDVAAIPLDKVKKSFENTLILSANDEESRSIIQKEVERLFLDDSIDFAESAVVTTAQRHSALVCASECLGKAVDLLLKSDDQTIAGSLCEDAISALEQSSGRSVSEDVVNHIFSKFCVGK